MEFKFKKPKYRIGDVVVTHYWIGSTLSTMAYRQGVIDGAHLQDYWYYSINYGKNEKEDVREKDILCKVKLWQK